MSLHQPFTRIKKPLKSDMNVVPYIDVMLVLLVIFMVTAPMLTAGLRVDLPEASNQTLPMDQNLPAVVTIHADGSYYLRLDGNTDQRISLEQLASRLTLAQAQKGQSRKQLTILINGDKQVPYGDVIRLMSTLQQQGFSQVGLLTQNDITDQ